ncbi:MAG: LPS export ABC transporter permease LptG [Wenzhouxiangella sp.]
MRIIREYLIGSLLRAFLVAAAAIGALLWLLELLQYLEGGVAGLAEFVAIAFGALQSVPEALIDLLPIVTILATAAAVGGLQARSEMTVMRAAGLSIWRLTGIALIPGLLISLMALAALEWVTPRIQQGPEPMMGAALGESGLWHPAHGLWVRQGDEFLNVAEMRLGRIPTGINLYRFSSAGALEEHLEAASAVVLADGAWRLEQVRRRDFSTAAELPEERLDSLDWDSFLPIRQLELLLSPPASLALSDLWAYVGGLKARGQESAEVDMMLWRRIALPLSCLAMVLAAMATAAVPLKSRTVSVRLVAAMTLGLGFQLLAELASYLGLVLEWPAPPVALLPPLALVMLSAWLLNKAR